MYRMKFFDVGLFACSSQWVGKQDIRMKREGFYEVIETLIGEIDTRELDDCRLTERS